MTYAHPGSTDAAGYVHPPACEDGCIDWRTYRLLVEQALRRDVWPWLVWEVNGYVLGVLKREDRRAWEALREVAAARERGLVARGGDVRRRAA